VYHTPRAVPQGARIDLDCADIRLVHRTKEAVCKSYILTCNGGPGCHLDRSGDFVLRGELGVEVGLWSGAAGGCQPKIEQQNVTLARSLNIAVLMSCGGSGCPMRICRMKLRVSPEFD
jgi:hypothetical protein